MKTGTHYIIEVHYADRRDDIRQAVSGLHTDDLVQALRRAQRLWESGVYSLVSVVEATWRGEVAAYVSTGQTIRVWGDDAAERIAA